MNHNPFKEHLEGIEIITNPWAQQPPWEEQNRYLQSDKNLEICKPFRLECERLSKVAAEYADQLQTWKDTLRQEVEYEEHSTKGEVLHRGFYCPSPIQDIVIGNSNRGRLLQRMTKRSKPTFKYGFNSKGEIILVDHINYEGISPSVEVILREGEKELGITFQIWKGMQQIIRVSECIYRDNRIVAYTDGHGDSFDPKRYVSNIRREEYTYANEGLDVVHMYEFNNYKATAPLLNHREYRFKHHDEGYLSCYAVIYHPKMTRSEPYWEGHVYDALIKRKV